MATGRGRVFVYLFLFAVAAIGVILTRPNPDPRKSLGGLWLMLLLVTALVGLRFEVGADWPNYANIFREISMRDFDQIVGRSEALFQLLNWAVHAAGFELWLVNLVCAFLFSTGLMLFLRRLPDPWLGAVAAVPYLIVVVAMGYTRQSVAIGLVFMGLSSFLVRPSTLRFAIYVTLAALFHRTAVVVFPIVAFANPRNRFINALIAVAAGLLLWDAFLADSIDVYVKNYVDVGYSSQGAAIRIAMSAVAAAIFFAARQRLRFSPVEDRLWRNFAIMTVAVVIALALSPSSTAVDRIALYLFPLQIAIFARAPALMRDWRVGRATVVAAEASTLLAWLFFAVHARFWLPYSFYPL